MKSKKIASFFNTHVTVDPPTEEGKSLIYWGFDFILALDIPIVTYYLLFYKQR